MSLNFYENGYHFNQEKGFLKEEQKNFQGFVGDDVLVHFSVWETAEVFPTVELETDFAEVELFSGGQTQAYVGRGMTFGEIPQGPNVAVYDYLKPVKAALPAKTQQYFTCRLTLKKAGKFTGKINVGKEILTFNVNVAPFEEVAKNFSLELWQYPYAVARYAGLKPEELFTPKHEKLTKQSLKRYQEAGGNAIAVTIVEDPWNHQTFDPYPSLVRWEKVADHFQFDFSHFDTYVQWNLDLGIAEKIKSFSLVPWENRIFYYHQETLVEERPEIGSQRWEEIWEEFLTAYITHLTEKGWFDMTYIAMDERPLKEMGYVIDLIKKCHNAKGQCLKLSGALNYQGVDSEILDAYHDISVSQSHLGDFEEFRDFCQQRREKGLMTSLYNCVGDYPSMFSASQPQETALILWFGASLEVDGFLRWALDAWSENPFETVNHWYWESGDPFLIYPENAVSPRFLQLQTTMQKIRHYKKAKETNERQVAPLTEFLQTLHLPAGKENTFGARVAKNSGDEEKIHDILGKLEELYEQVVF